MKLPVLSGCELRETSVLTEKPDTSPSQAVEPHAASKLNFDWRPSLAETTQQRMRICLPRRGVSGLLQTTALLLRS